MLPDRESPILTPERHALLERIVAEGDRRRRTRLVGGGGALVLVVGLMAAVLTAVGDGDQGREVLAIGGSSPSTAVASVPPPIDSSPSTTVPSIVPGMGSGEPPGPTGTSTPTPTTVAPTPSLPGTWAALPPSGLAARFGGVQAWTGRELLVLGGTTASSNLTCSPSCAPPSVYDGAAFNPATNTWRRLAASPVPTLVAGAWTGSELVVWGGTGTPVAAAYDPAGDTWRTLPAGPLPLGMPATAVALGGEVYVLRSGLSSATDPEAAALDPATGMWRVLPDPPAHTSVLAAFPLGGEVVAVLRGVQPTITVAAMAPSGVWRVVAAGPAGNGWWSAVVAGGRVWAVSCPAPGNAGTPTVTSFDPATGVGTPRAVPADGCPTLVAAGDDLIALTSFPNGDHPETIRVHQAVGDGWRELSPPPASRVGAASWTGAEVLFWGGCDCPDRLGPAIEAGYRLRL